jgi:hypothetical protein
MPTGQKLPLDPLFFQIAVLRLRGVARIRKGVARVLRILVIGTENYRNPALS